MRGDDDSLIADLDAIAIEIGACGRSQHHAGAIIACKDQRLFNRALRQHHLFCAHAPHTLTRRIGGRLGLMIGQAFAKTNHVLMVIADGRRARQKRDIRIGFKGRYGFVQPVPACAAIDDRLRFRQKRAAKFGLLVDEDDLRATLCGFKGGGQTGRSTTGNQHIAESIAAGIGVRIGLGRRFAKTGSATDERLINLVPEAFRPHEGLVVKACREEHVERIIDRADIVLQRRPMVLGFGLETIIEFQHRCAGVRLKPTWSTRDAHQCIRLFGTGRKNAARAVIFERTTGQMFAIGKQRGCQCVTFKTGIGLAVEAEWHGLGLFMNPHIGHHFVSAAGVSAKAGRGSPAL